MINILVTGANGQLGKCIQDAVSAEELVNYRFVFASREMLSITNKKSIQDLFNNHTFEYCINTAAYTNVEKAESEKKAAFEVNAKGVKQLAEVCEAHTTTLIHISTDYVFEGTKGSAYLETDSTNPINVYGASKLAGEAFVKESCKKHFILRTSWLYSQYGHNFLKTIVKHGKAGTSLKITTEQTGTPTNANDLAKVILKFITTGSEAYGLYHFSNTGTATWYDFAKEILTQSSELNTSNLAKTEHYRTFAKRPEYSVLHTGKLENTLNTQLVDWKKSLASVLPILETT